MLREINGWRTRVMDFGSGDRVLVTHGGWTGSWELWEQQAERLSRDGWRVIAYDHRGSGFNPAPEADELSVHKLADDLLALLDELGIERCVLAGESMGTAVATLAALRQPERFEGMVLVAGSAIWRKVSLLPFLAGLTAAYRATIRLFIVMAVPEKQDRHYYRRWGLSILRQARAGDARRLIRGIVGLDLRPQLAQVRVPTLVIHGTRDLIVPLREGRALAAKIPGAEFLPIAGAGHVPSLTRADEVSDAIVRRFG